MSEHTVTPIDLRAIVPGANDRTVFDPKGLRDLADNIAAHGLIQPITVRRCGESELFEIVAGERRFRALTLLGWQTAPCLVADLTDEEASAVMLAENVSRQDIDPLDEARAYQARISHFGWSVDDCARNAGVTTVRVLFRLKLLRLAPDLQDAVRRAILPLGYAQTLADSGLDTNRQRLAVAKLRDNPNPTPGWFRRICADLLAVQAQQPLLDDMPLLSGALAALAPAQPPTPPHPATHTPPRSTGGLSERIEAQIAFWQQAAEAWGELGKPFKRQECEAAARALQLALE